VCSLPKMSFIVYAMGFLAMILCARGLKLRSDVQVNFASGTGRVDARKQTYTFTLSSTVCNGEGGKVEVLTGSNLDQSSGEITVDGSGTSFTVSQATIKVKFNNDYHDGTCDRNVLLTYSDGTFAASKQPQFGAGHWDCNADPPGDSMRCNAVKAGQFKWGAGAGAEYDVTFTHTGASGDPKAVNVRGEKFDIQRLGTFNFLAITNASDSNSEGIPLMSLDATVGRAGPSCDHTYILNLTLSGSWIQEASPTKIKIRAVPHRLKNRALEIFFNDEWHEMSEIKKNRGQGLKILQKATAEALVLDMHGVKIAVSVDLHRIRPAMEYASFLNVDVKGINQLIGKDGIHLHGLLAYDDHAFATEAPDDCKMHSERRQLLFNDVSSQPALTSMMQPALMSIVRLSS